MGSQGVLLETGLQQAVAQFVADNPKSKQNFENASKHLPAGNTRTTLFAEPFPLFIVSASGCRVTSADGREYLDMIGEYTAGIYGHSHPEIIAALQEGLTKGVNFGGTSPLEGELAGLIKTRFEQGAGLEMLRFTNSGTESNLLAVATARIWRGKNKVLVFDNAYHGSLQAFQGQSQRFNIPGEYVIAKYNSISSVDEVLSQLEPDSLAAILVEPMQGAGGSFPASKKFLQYLRDKATKLDALLIFDEVMTSRLYYAGGLSGKYGIKPDMITMGKYLGGGMGIGLFGGRKEIMDLFNPQAGGTIKSRAVAEKIRLTHSGTFNNNVMTMYGGIAGAKILTPEVFESLNAMGDYMRASITQLLKSRSLIPTSFPPEDLDEPDIDRVPRGPLWISGIGSINTIHFGRQDEAGKLRNMFYFHMIEHGIYVSGRGFVVLTIQHKKEDVDQFVKAIETFIDRWAHLLEEV